MWMDADYAKHAKDEIARWESEGPGFIAQVGDVVLWPAQKAAEILVPESVQEAVAKAIETFLASLDFAARVLIDAEEVRARVSSLREVAGDDLKSADQAAKHYWNWHVGYAATEGAVTGAFGLVGLAADIPALFTIELRLIQQIGICYGYDVYKENEQEYVLHILRTGSTGDLKAKLEFLIGLKEIEQILLKVAWKKMNEAFARKEMSRIAALAALRQFAKSLGIQVTKRKALQMIPVVGALVGASFNGTFTNDIGRAAYMSYRRRWIAESGVGDTPVS
ncbi:MAG: hypothetical protein DMD89_38520 [Candidatus Rokuibacteriota bacterium]|nr:MAG: hypothetical protein DMD89_38520 [Candidatus Rokubacteria bacterium]